MSHLPSSPVPYVANSVLVTPTGSGHTGDTSEFIGWYANIPGGLLGANGFLAIDHLWDSSAGGAAAGLTVYLRIVAGTSAGTTAGTALISNSTAITTVPSRWKGLWTVSNLGAVNSQTCFATSASSGASAASALVAGAIDTDAAFTISMNAKLANSGDTAWVKYGQILVYRRS